MVRGCHRGDCDGKGWRKAWTCRFARKTVAVVWASKVSTWEDKKVLKKNIASNEA